MAEGTELPYDAFAARVYVESLFSEKDAVKQRGGYYDGERRKWYLPAGSDPSPWQRIPTPVIIQRCSECREPLGVALDDRVYLQSTFDDNQIVRAMPGAAYDFARKTWYLRKGSSPDPFLEIPRPDYNGEACSECGCPRRKRFADADTEPRRTKYHTQHS